MTVIANTLLFVGILALVLRREFITQAVRPTAFIWIAILIVRGCVPPGPARATTAGIAFLVGALFLSLVFGVLRGITKPMWLDAAGRAYSKGGLLTAGLWIITIIVRLGLGAYEHAAFGEPFSSEALWLGMGVTLLIQRLVMTGRARSGQIPVREGTPAAVNA